MPVLFLCLTTATFSLSLPLRVKLSFAGFNKFLIEIGCRLKTT